MQPVLETVTPDGFDLWPVAEIERFGFLPLNGQLSPAAPQAAERIRHRPRPSLDFRLTPAQLRRLGPVGSAG